MILFLDFDGVLHSEPCYDKSQQFAYLPRLESVLRDFPDVRIVISSTWREKRSISQLCALFSVDIGVRIAGVTPFWQDIPDIADVIGYRRHSEIEGWLRQSGEPWEAWVAIDDKPYLFRPFLKNLIRTYSAIGFDERAEISLRQYLTKS